MKTFKLNDMIKGWFIGGFTPTAYHTNDVEVGYRVHKKGPEPAHYHTTSTEVNLIVSGNMIIQGKHLNEGDIFILEPWEITNPFFLEDCGIICVKIPISSENKIYDKKMLNSID